MADFVIIGNGVAAVGCIEGIRSVDKNSKITVISAEKHKVYGRPLISYYLEGKTTTEKMNYRKEDFYEENKCEVLYGKEAVKIDKDEKTVYLDDDSKLKYDKLCIATGSSPFVPPFSGIEKVKKKFTFMTVDDALNIEKELAPDKKVLIVGAGLIGLKCAEGISKRVKEITVADLSTRVLSSILDDECAKLVQKHIEKENITFKLGCSVSEFYENSAKLQNGEIVDFDILILAVGVRANTKIAVDADIETNRGIIVDEKSQTSACDIFAAGDCTEGTDSILNQKRIIAILPNAYFQGNAAGKNMAGESSSFDNAIPMNSIGFFGLHAMTAGNYFSEADGGICYEEKSEEGIKRLYIKDGALTGYIIIGEIHRTGIYTSMIRNKTPLADVDLDLLKKSPSLGILNVEI